MQAKNLAIMLTDIKGFTDKTSRKSRDQIKEMLANHNALVLPVIEKHQGKLIKTIGDAFLVTFESSTDAVLCGVAVQEALASFNKDKAPDDRLDIRIAINAGEVYIDNNTGDIFGEAVNITSRIEGIAEAGEVFFTEAVYLSMNRNEVPSSEIGYRQFKGIPEKIKVYKVLHEDPVTEHGPAEDRGADAPRGSGAGPSPSPAPETPDPGSVGDRVIKGIAGMLGKFGMQNIDIEEDGKRGPKRVRIANGEIHVVEDGKEIHIGKDGIKIQKKAKKEGNKPER